MAGTYQQSRFRTLMENYASSVDLYNEALTQATGNTDKKFEIYKQSMEAKMNDLKNSMNSIFTNIFTDSAVGGTLGAFNGILSAIDKTIESVGFLGVALAGLGMYLTNFKGGFKIFDVQNFKSIEGVFTDNALKRWNDFRDTVKTTNTHIDTYARKMALANGSMQPNIIHRMSAGLRVMATSATMAKIKMLALKGATLALNSIVGIGIGVLSSFAIGAVINGITKLINAQDELKQKTEETIQTATQNIQNNDSQIKSLTELSAEYENLSGKSNLTAEEQKKLNEIRSEIAGISPSLIKGYDEEGNAILESTNKMREYVEVLKERNKHENLKIVNAKIENEGNDQKEYDKAKKERDEAKKTFDTIKQNIADMNKELDSGKVNPFTGTQDILKDSIAREEQKLAKFESIYEASAIKVKELEDANKSFLPTLLSTVDGYDKLGESAKNAVKNMVENDKDFKTMTASELKVKAKETIDSLKELDMSQLQDKLGKVNIEFEGKFNTKEYEDSVKKIIDSFPQLKNESEEVKKSLVKALSVSANEVDSSGINKQIEKINELKAMSVEDLGKEFNKITKDIQGLNEILYNLDHGKLIGSSLSSAIESYPQLISLMGDDVAMRKWITEEISNQEEVQRQAYIAMIENDEEYFKNLTINNESIKDYMLEIYTKILQAHGQLTEEKAKHMKDDLENSKTLAEAKAKVEENLIKGLLGAWASYYNATTGKIDFDSARENGLKVKSRDDYLDLKAQAQGIKEDSNKAVDEINKAIASIKMPSFKSINMGKSQVKDATKKEKKKAEKKEKEPFQQDAIANQQKKLNLELEKYNKLLEDSAKHTKKHLEYLKEKRELLKQQIELTKQEIAYQSQLSRTALPPTTGSSSGGTVTLGNGATSKIDSVIQNAVDNYTNHKVQYVYGGKSLKNGIDCSGFMVELYKQMGIEISGGTAQLSKKGVKVDKNSLQKGDLVFFKGANQHGNGIGHVGMYIGNGQYIHAANKKDDVKVSNLSSAKDFVTARRIANFGGSTSNVVKPTTANNKKFTVTYYTDLPSENGGYTTNAYGQKLQKGMVASNYYKKGTKIYLDGIGEVTVADKGGSAFNKDNRLDIFVPRNAGESDSAYLKRVNAMGKKTVNGSIGGVGSDTSYITNENRQKAFDAEISARQKLLDLLQQQKDLEFEIKKAERIYMDQANIERLEKLITRSEEFYKGKASGSDDAIRNLDDVLVRYEQILISQDKIRNELLDLSKDQTITEAQRYQALQEHYDAEIKYWQTKTTYQETYLKKVKEQLYGKSEVEINYKEGVKRRNLTNTSYYMENTPENLKALENTLKIQREIAEMREKEKNDAYNLYNDKEHRKNLSDKQIQDLKQEYIDRDNVFYEARKELDELTKKTYEVKLEVKLKLPNYKIEQLKRELEILEAKDPENYKDKTRLNKWIYTNEKSKKKTLEQELKELEITSSDLKGYMEGLSKYGDAESKRIIAESEKKLKTNNDLIEETKEKLAEQEVATAQAIRSYIDALKEEFDVKLNVVLDLKDEELNKLKNKITELENYNDEDYNGLLDLNKEALFVEKDKGREIQKQLIDLTAHKYKLEEELSTLTKGSELYLEKEMAIKAINESIDETNMKLSDQNALISQQVDALIEAERNMLDNQAQHSIFGKKKIDYEYEMNLRLDDYNKQIKAIEDETKYLTADEKKWQLELITDDIKSESRTLENPAQKARLEVFYEELKVLESIDNLEQDRVDKVKYQLDIEKAKIKLENLQNQKSIRALKKGEDGTFKWTYVADQDAIDQAQKELKEKQYEFSKWQTDKDRKDRREDIQEKIDAENERYDNMVKSYEEQMRLIDDSLKEQKIVMMKEWQAQNDALNKTLSDKDKMLNKNYVKEEKDLIDHNKKMDETLNAGLETLKKTNETQWTSMVNTTSSKVAEMQKLIDEMVANLERIKSLESAIASANAKLEETKSKSSTSTEGSNSKSDSSSAKSAGKSMASLDTGGYTGSFSGGRMAILHEKELVLNKADTQNILDSVKLNRNFVGALKKFDFSKIINSIPKTSPSAIGGDTYKVEKLYVELPNVTSAVDTIKETFYDLSSGANQYFSKV